MSRARQAGYRLLGRHFDYLLHLRPAEWPIVAAHAAVGALLATGLGAGRSASAAAGIALWVICLNGGTLALNSAYDRDQGDVAYLHRPPPPPPHLARFSLGLMLLGQALALALPAGFVLAYAICLVLSVLYSVPPFRLKAVAGADWAINMWGFGTLTPYAGWSATGTPLDPARGLVLLAFCPLFAALYPLTQLYQLEEDRARGDRTLAIVLGPRRSLDVAIAAAAVAFVLFAVAGLRAGWRLEGSDPARWAGLILAAVAWSVVLAPWRTRYATLDAPAQQRGMYRALAAWAVTDIVVVLAWGL